jgi:pyridoxine 4-dehydrogenase
VDPAVPLEESLGTLIELREEGKVRHLGLSNVDVDQLDTALALTPVVSVQNRYNLGDRGSEGVIERCEQEALAFLPWYPVGAGSTAEFGDALGQVARAHDATVTQVALAWLLARSPAMLPIPGTSSLAHLEENTAAAELRLSPEEVDLLGGG